MVKGKGVVGRRVFAPSISASGEWIVRAVHGANVRVRRSYGGMSFLVPRADVKFLRESSKLVRPLRRGEVVVRSSRGL